MSLKKHMPSTLSELQLQLNLFTKEAFPSHMHISQQKPFVNRIE